MADADQLISPTRYQLLSYISHVWAGNAGDQKVEALSISADLGLDTLDLVEILLALSEDLGIKSDTVSQKMRYSKVKVPGAEDYDDDKGGWASLANLFARIAKLAEANLSEEQRDALLIAGVVGPGNEVRPFDARVSVGFIVKYCRAILM
jgi:acyl carrier protein